MKIPNYVLKDRVTISRFLGNTGYGPKHDTQTNVRCSFEEKRKQATDRDGNKILCEAVALFRPEVSIDLQDKVTHAGRDYTVEQVKKQPNAARPHHLEVLMR